MMNMTKKFFVMLLQLVPFAICLAYSFNLVLELQADADRVSDMAVAVNRLNQARMLNRLSLLRFLLNGDPKEAEAIAVRGHEIAGREADGLITVAEQKAIGLGPFGEGTRALLERMRSDQTIWERDFAVPLMAARRLVDNKKSAIAEMQITFLQNNPQAWEERDAEPEKKLNNLLDTLMAGSRDKKASAQTPLMIALAGNFILMLIFAIRSANLPSTSEKEALAIHDEASG